MILIVLPDIPMEQDLLDRARRGDLLAQRTIYEQYFSPVYNFIRMRVNDRDTAQDIAADVFLDFFRALGKKRAPESSLRGWLFRVARHKVIDSYGADKRLSGPIDEWHPDTPDNMPDIQFMRASQAERVREALRLLKPEQQEVLLLRFAQNLSLEETADLMDRSVSAVKSLQFRAADNLRRLLNDLEKEA
jgi:RNA polymerase sigma-70 factor, ECF subfamily